MADRIDRSLKVLMRQVMPAFLRLVGVEADPATVRLTDVSVNLPEHRADQVFLIGAEEAPDRFGMHVEFQTQPDRRTLRGWFLKNAALTAQLDRDVILVALYLTRGDRATFPDSYTATGGGLENAFRFRTIYLWERAERIRSGELPELAPLLVLCEENPTEETLREERRLILELDAPREVRADLLAVAAMVGSRYFARELLAAIFREELEMIKEGSLFDEWLEEALKEGLEQGRQQGLQQGLQQGIEEGRQQGLQQGIEQGLQQGIEQGLQQGIEQGLQQGIEQGLQQGEAQGEARAARHLLLRLLAERFGELPASAVTRIEAMTPAECEVMATRLLKASSLAELGLAES
jgi:flagellar biosynthesis/type III secretory pathway protein FliH